VALCARELQPVVDSMWIDDAWRHNVHNSTVGRILAGVNGPTG